MRKLILVLVLLFLTFIFFGCTQNSKESRMTDFELLKLFSEEQLTLLNKCQTVMAHSDFGYDGRSVT